jgi:cytoskeletal protein CcmA (bactofilin family)
MEPETIDHDPLASAAPPKADQPAIDTGLGVPPRPPATALNAPMKDQTMGRPPFATLPATPAGNQPAASGNNPPFPAAPPRPPGMPATPVARTTGTDRPAVNAPERRTLVVGRGISVQGIVQDAERLVVEGTVEATMIHAAELSVSQGGIFKGEIEVENAEVAGTVDGTITVRGNLIVRATGSVLGTARCRRLQVEDGGQITGRIEMLSEQPRANTAPTSSPRLETFPTEPSRSALSYES